ncbi:hypothetical protein B9W62_37170 [Streptomyces sp. CS113]|uniref:hypothetical protein n=1 Tax=Streptomyces sp. CS113 TaxID=1982761 RepID=UPI000B4073E7|nr:hypothetical protein [Streptomyces sp. CS113]OVZ99824.1 hypothetical protein B9W62_37170 [Streptomyces sp. CS113]
MRSARMLLTTAAASAVFVLGAPGAYAAVGGDWDHDDSSYSKEHDNGSKHDEPRGGMHTGGGALSAVTEGDWDHEDASSGKTHDNGSKHEDGGKHEEPRGGMHTGGGALAAVNEGDWDGGGRESKEGGSQTYRQDEGESSRGSGEHEKPRGGMHTGGGGLATPTTTAGGLAVLAVAATGLYAVRRKKSAGGVA